jgi:hypothetical protein
MNVQFLTLSPALSDRQWRWEGRRMAYVATDCLLLLLWHRRVGVGHGADDLFLDFWSAQRD